MVESMWYNQAMSFWQSLRILSATERGIDEIVYRLNSLNPAEIALIEEAVS